MAMTRWRAASLACEHALFKTGDVQQDVHIDILMREWIRKGEGGLTKGIYIYMYIYIFIYVYKYVYIYMF